MQQVTGFPPNIDEILKVFPDAAKPGVIFAYGDIIYVPTGQELSFALVEHEQVHGDRQNRRGVAAWWDQYLVDGEFRFNEELPAHQVEYRAFCDEHTDRNLRSQYLNHIAARLASPLYGNLLSQSAARKAITEKLR